MAVLDVFQGCVCMAPARAWRTNSSEMQAAVIDRGWEESAGLGVVISSYSNLLYQEVCRRSGA